MVHEIGVLQCACDDIFGMISPLPTFNQPYHTPLASYIHQKYITMTPTTSSTTHTPTIPIQNKSPMHYTFICVHGPIFCTHEAYLARFLCPIFLCPIFWPDYPNVQNFLPEKFPPIFRPQNFLHKFFFTNFF